MRKSRESALGQRKRAMTIDAKNVLRLNMPQWQGGDRPAYRLGAKVLAAIAPEPQGPVETIAVPPSARPIRPIDGWITSRAALLDQLNAARSAIVRHKTEAIVTLGGDCLGDLAPIAYLSERYGDDLAVLWADAHPDVMPAQTQNAHAHVLAILMDEFAKAQRSTLAGLSRNGFACFGQ